MKRIFRIPILVSALAVTITIQIPSGFAGDPQVLTPRLSPPNHASYNEPGFYSMTWLVDGDVPSTSQLPPRPKFSDVPHESLTSKSDNISNLWAEFVLPRCSQNLTEQCVDKMEFQDLGDETWQSIDFQGYLPIHTEPFLSPGRHRYLTWSDAEIDFVKSSLFRTTSSRSSLWTLTLKDTKHTFMLTPSLGFDPYYKYYNSLEVVITPIHEIFIKDPIQYEGLNPNTTWCARTGYADSLFSNSIFHPLSDLRVEDKAYDYCLVKEDFPLDTKLRVQLKVSRDLLEFEEVDWMSSRTRQSRAYIEASRDTNMLVLEGFPAVVQSGVMKIPQTNVGYTDFLKGSPEIQAAIDKGTLGKDASMASFGVGTGRGGGQGNYGYGWNAINLWKATEKYLDPKLTSEHQLWSFSGTRLVQEANDLANKCSDQLKERKNFAGLVSTNATVFVKSPPRLDQNGDLEFHVAATHLIESGDRNFGTYDLSISEDLATCIWGRDFSRAALTLNVIQEDGLAQLVTSSIQKANNQIHFHASGFHYSVNTIRIELKKDSDGKASVDSTSASLPNKGQGKKTITCQKGKMKKVVLKSSLKCPKGFKKVS